MDPSQGLYERMTTDHDAGRPHIGALALTAALERSRDHALDHVREGRSAGGDDLRRGALPRQRRGEKPLC